MVEVGYCKFCGQSRAVPEECVDLNEYATMHCSCDLARKYQFKSNQYEMAENMVNNYVGADHPLKGLLMDIIKSLQEQTSIAHTIRLTKRVKLALSITGDGEIKIKRTVTDTDEDRV